MLFFPHLVNGEQGEVRELGHTPDVGKDKVNELSVVGARNEREVADQCGFGEDAIGCPKDLVAGLRVD